MISIKKHKSQKVKKGELKPMKVKRARFFSLLGLLGVVCLCFFLLGNDEVGSFGLISLLVAVVGIASTGVHRVVMKPSDEFERNQYYKAMSHSFGITAIATILFLVLAKLVAQQVGFHNGEVILSPQGFFENLYMNTRTEDPTQFWDDLYKVVGLILIFLPSSILAWLMPMSPVEDDGI